MTSNNNIKNTNKIRILFYSFWFSGLLIQAFFTELNEDEAYYWMYSKYMSWGYFDHPPMIALMIKIGYSFFPNELGVRLIPILTSTFSLFIWEKIIQPKEIKTYFLLLLSVGILHFISFIATPDAPLIFFTSLFLLAYKKFIFNPNMQTSIKLGVLVSLILLSKYHGILIIAAVILSNFKLIYTKYFWIAFVVATIILTPHILWQIESGFPSIKYHLLERSSSLYSVNFTVEFLLSQLFVLGPFTGILFFISMYKIKTKNQFEKTLKYIFWTGYIFFFFMTFKGRTEAHWTLFTIVPAIYFGYQFLIQTTKRQKTIRVLFYTSLGLILLARAFISIDLKPNSNSIIAQLTNSFRNKEKMQLIYQKSKKLPVAFMNSYQNASLYEFYSNSTGFSLNNIMGRKNQYDLWNFEDNYRRQKIMIIPNYNVKRFDSIKGLSKTLKYSFINNFQSFSKIQIHPLNILKEGVISDTLNIKIKFKHYNNIDIENNKNYSSYISYHFFKGEKLIKEGTGFKITNSALNKIHHLKINTPNNTGTYKLHFSIRTGWLPPTINSNSYKIKLKE